MAAVMMHDRKASFVNVQRIKHCSVRQGSVDAVARTDAVSYIAWRSDGAVAWEMTGLEVSRFEI